MESQSFEFAGVKSKILIRGVLSRPAILKMLRSGKARVVDVRWFCTPTGAAWGSEKDPEELARLIAAERGEWTARPYNLKGGRLAIAWGSRLTIVLDDAPQSIAVNDAQAAESRVAQ